MYLIHHLSRMVIVRSLTALATLSPLATQALNHPGGLQTQDALTNARTQVAAGVEPWRSAWDALEATDAQSSYTSNLRDSNVTDEGALQREGHAAYVLAIKWAVSGDMKYATAARNVLDNWVDTAESFEFGNFPLRMGIGSIQMANAAEIIATAFDGAAGWPQENINRARTWFRDVVDPTVTTGSQRSSNWGTSALAGGMSIAIFLDDQNKFDDAVSAYKFGFQNTDDGCAHVTDYIWHPSGQSSESGRDQVHTEGGIGHLVETALMAWNQGVDVVSFADNRLVAGMEYTAKYNLGFDVPWTLNMTDECDIYPTSHEDEISPEGRLEFAPVWEMAGRLFSYADILHPYTEQVLNSEGYTYYPERTAGGSYRPETTNSDNPGMGTLLYSDPSPVVINPPTNSAPTVSFVTPMQNDSLNEGELLSVLVNANDTDGNIVSVDLSIDNIFVRTERVAAYEWGENDVSLQNLPAGNYTLTAVATDNDGLSAEAVISVSVGSVDNTPNFFSMKKANSTSFAIDGDNGGANEQNVYLWSYGADNVNQEWEEISRGNDFYSYKKRDTDFCLDGGNEGENRQSVILYVCMTDNQNQHWRKVRIGNNYRLEKRNAPGFSIDGDNNGANGQNIYLYKSSDSNLNQQWQFESK